MYNSIESEVTIEQSGLRRIAAAEGAGPLIATLNREPELRTCMRFHACARLRKSMIEFQSACLIAHAAESKGEAFHV